MSDYDLTERERFTRQAEWDKFSLEHRNDFQSTFSRTVAKEAFVAAFEAGLKLGRGDEDADRKEALEAIHRRLPHAASCACPSCGERHQRSLICDECVQTLVRSIRQRRGT